MSPRNKMKRIEEKFIPLVMVEDEFITRTWNTEQIKMNLFLLIINSKKVKKKKKVGESLKKKQSLIIVDWRAWL